MKTIDNDHRNKLSAFTKISFAMAGLPYQMLFCAISVFATVFLLDVAKLNPDYVSIVLFTSRILDAITDPIYGYYVNRTPITRWGRMKPWIAISFPITAVCYIAMWYIPYNFSQFGKFIWFLIGHSLLFTIITGIRIPHITMTMYLTKSLEERQSATIFRMAFEMIGLLLALFIQAPLVHTGGVAVQCDHHTGDDQTTTYSPMTTTTTPHEFIDPVGLWNKQRYAVLAAILIVIHIIGNFMLLLYVKERTDIDTKTPILDQKSESEGGGSVVMKELKQMFTFGPFLLLLSASMFSMFAVQVVQATLELFAKYGYPPIKPFFEIVIIGILFLAIVLVPLWTWALRKLGKRICYIIGNLALMPLLIVFLFFRSGGTVELTVIFILAAVASNAFTGIFLVPWAMLPDCMDAYFIKYKTRPDALFYTFFGVLIKVLMAIYLGLQSLVLDLVGYESNVCPNEQESGVSTAILMLFAPAPLISLILSTILIYFYPIDEQKAKENSEMIHAMKGDVEQKQKNHEMKDFDQKYEKGSAHKFRQEYEDTTSNFSAEYEMKL